MHCLPITNFTTAIQFDDGLMCGLYKKMSYQIAESFPPDNCIKRQVDGAIQKGTFQSFPIEIAPHLSTEAYTSASDHYFDDQNTTYVVPSLTQARW